MSVTLTLTESGHSPGHMRLNDASLSGGVHKREIKETREAELVVFDNTTQGLGLKICGGCSQDGRQEHGIFVKRVLPGGLAESSDCIQNGDLILEVNKQSMDGITYDRAVSMLRQASASNHVEIVVTRDEEAKLQFVHYMSLQESSQSPRNFNNDVAHDPNYSADGDIDFHRKMNAFLKDTSLEDFNSSGDHNDANVSARAGEFNGHISPTSSTTSELANHLGEASFSPRGQAQSNKALRPSQGQGMSVDGLDSLLSKKLSQDPGLRLHIDQLESAMIKLGFNFTPTTQQAVRERLSVDSDGMVKFEEFVQVARSFFHKDLGALKGRITPHTNADMPQGANNMTVVKERDVLLAEVAALKMELQNQTQLCQSKEEQLLFIRKQMQVVIEEGRSLKSKLHLAEQAQARAQQTEHDYEEVVAMLENEVSQLRLQASKSDGSGNVQKRLAVLVCQLKKADSGKKTYEVATEKLIRYVEHSLEVLSSVENSPRGLDGAKAKSAKMKSLTALSAEGREVIKTVRSLMESVPLPFGWEEAYTSDGVRYYINHMNQTTTWTHPVSCMEHQTNTKTSTAGQEKTQLPPPAQNLPPPPPPPAHPQQQPSTENLQNLPSRLIGDKSQTSAQDPLQNAAPNAPPRKSAKKREERSMGDKNVITAS